MFNKICLDCMIGWPQWVQTRVGFGEWGFPLKLGFQELFPLWDELELACNSEVGINSSIEGIAIDEGGFISRSCYMTRVKERSIFNKGFITIISNLADENFSLRPLRNQTHNIALYNFFTYAISPHKQGIEHEREGIRRNVSNS